jgi:SAM-dependent methyltransferase
VTRTFQDHFSGVAPGYAEFRPRYPAALFAYLAGLTPSHLLAWDCACGNGQATVGLASHYARVIGTDASAAQIANAEARANVEYRVAPAEASGLPDASVELVTVAQALHWLEVDRFYAEVRRVLVPGGVLAVWAYWRVTADDDAVTALVDEFYGKTVGPYWPPERKLVEQGYRTIPFPFTELTTPEFAVTADWTLNELLGYMRTWSATSRYVAARGEDPVVAFAPRVAAVWGDAARRRRMTWALGLRVGRP